MEESLSMVSGFGRNDPRGETALWTVGLVLDLTLADELLLYGCSIAYGDSQRTPKQRELKICYTTFAVSRTLKRRGITWMHSPYHIGDGRQVHHL